MVRSPRIVAVIGLAREKRMHRSGLRTAGAALVAAMFGGTAFAEELIPATELVVEKTVPFEATYSHINQYDTGTLFAYGAVWTVVHPYLVRIDPNTYEEKRVEMPGITGPIRPIAAGEGAVWVADTGTNTVFKIDPETMVVGLAFRASMLTFRSALGFGDGSLWMVTAENAERMVTRFDLQTGEVQARIPLPGGAVAGVTFANGSAWVGGSEKSEVYRIDPATNAIAAAISICARPSFIESGEGAVFVNCSARGELSRIDPSTGTVTSTVLTGSPEGAEIDIGGGYVWLATFIKQLIQVDPATGQIVRSYTGRDLHLEANVSYGDGSLWMVRVRPKGAIYRIKPPE